jgi:hypothetical protein
MFISVVFLFHNRVNKANKLVLKYKEYKQAIKNCDLLVLFKHFIFAD